LIVTATSRPFADPGPQPGRYQYRRFNLIHKPNRIAISQA